MELATIILIGIALAMDSFAVSITSGMVIKRLKLEHALWIAAIFALFHAIMLPLGWYGGVNLKEALAGFDHWIAFLLLAAVGGHMIHDALGFGGEDHYHDPLNIKVISILAFATSIDAVAVGFSFAFIGVSILEPVLVIALIIFILSFTGVYIGEKMGRMIGRRMELVGGIVLIGIGIRILIDHI